MVLVKINCTSKTILKTIHPTPLVELMLPLLISTLVWFQDKTFFLDFRNCFFFTGNVVAPEDKAEIIITPLAQYDNFISAVVSKLGMNDARKFNYFLSLCKTTDSPNLPESFVYMSETNEFQEKSLHLN